MKMNKIYHIVNKLNMFYDMIGTQIKVNEILDEEELILLIDYINLMEGKLQENVKILKKKK